MKLRWTLAILATTTGAALAACGSDSSKFDDALDEGHDGGVSPVAPAPGFGRPDDGGEESWFDFPKDPIIDTSDLDGGASTSTPANAAELFESGSTGTEHAPCLLEPEIGSLVPKNWLRPRFRWTVPSDANIFEIRVHVENQVNDLVVYTTASRWTMPKEMWDGLRAHSAAKDISISIRGGKYADGVVSGITKGSSGPWEIAPVEAPGSIVYWRIIGGSKADLKGFSAGDETVVPALDPSNVEQKAGTQCVGCHISSPDGKYAIFSSDNFGDKKYGIGIGSIEPEKEGELPPFLTSEAKDALENYLLGISTTAAPFWTTGKHLVVASREGEIRWVNLDGTTAQTVKGVVALDGHSRTRPNSPNLSHDGERLVYVSGNSETDGRPSGSNNDIWIVPFNEGAGGAAKALEGAATQGINEYYPSFSPDDRFVAFNRTTGGPYSSPNAEVFVVSSDGGKPQRLAANDPPECSGKTSPGVENSWPKWAPAKPAPETVDGKTYYWVVFSSTRFNATRRQLFMAPVVVDAKGTVLPYKALYLWNQPAAENNHTPAWDVFAIPPAPSGPK